jgi:hypothetical protein
MSGAQIKPGQRVWVADGSVPGGRRYGRIIGVDRRRGLLNSGGLLILLDGEHAVIARSTNGRGVEWDLAEGPE